MFNEVVSAMQFPALFTVWAVGSVVTINTIFYLSDRTNASPSVIALVLAGGLWLTFLLGVILKYAIWPH